MVEISPTASLPRTMASRPNTRASRRFDALYDAHAERLYRFCLRLTGGNVADAEDLTQEVLVAAFQGLPRFAGRSAVQTWLYRIAVCRWRVLREAQARGNAGGNAVALPEETTGGFFGDSTADAPILRLTLENALCLLPVTLREAFLLVKAEGMTHREAARVLQIPQGTVQSRVQEAVRRLRVSLSEEDSYGK